MEYESDNDSDFNLIEDYGRDAFFDGNTSPNQFMSEEEFLRQRKMRIQKLLNLYSKQNGRLKRSLRLKYIQFLRSREHLANKDLKEQNQDPNAICINFYKDDDFYSNNNDALEELMEEFEEEEKNEESTEEKKANGTAREIRMARRRKRMEQTQPVVKSKRRKIEKKNVIQKPEKPIIIAQKVEKQEIVLSDKTKKKTSIPEDIKICGFANCRNRAMMLSDYCFNHILYDEKQQLYINSDESIETFDEPIFLNSKIGSKKKGKRKKKSTIVSVEGILPNLLHQNNEEIESIEESIKRILEV